VNPTMNLWSLVYDKLARTGWVPFACWSALVFITIFVFHAYGAPLQGPELVGMGFVYAVLCIAGGWLWRGRLWRKQPGTKGK
jgi:hypothetical protein